MISEGESHTRYCEECGAQNDQEDSMAKHGYWVVCYKSVSNPAAISEYAKLAASALEALGGRVIVAANLLRPTRLE